MRSSENSSFQSHEQNIQGTILYVSHHLGRQANPAASSIVRQRILCGFFLSSPTFSSLVSVSYFQWKSELFPYYLGHIAKLDRQSRSAINKTWTWRSNENSIFAQFVLLCSDNSNSIPLLASAFQPKATQISSLSLHFTRRASCTYYIRLSRNISDTHAHWTSIGIAMIVNDGSLFIVASCSPSL